MNIIVFTKRHQRPLMLRLRRPMAAVMTVAVVVAGLFSGGYLLGRGTAPGALERDTVQMWRQQLAEQRAEVRAAKERAQAYIDALSLRLGRMQAHVIRLNALGRRLTKMANLDPAEFDFDQTPAQGGPAPELESSSREVDDILRSMDALATRMDAREQQLNALETMLLHSNLQKQVHPAGRPIRKGWISSYYGKRSDPFTGKPEHHSGVDFAGKLGSDVVAVAAGVVTWSGERYGYGNMVEIDHGNGFVTRYAHNRRNLVKVGDKVAQGQQVAEMGSSGRSTGPHVHFEVLHKGRVVNPYKYIRARR